MANRFMTNAFEGLKNFIWTHTHKDAAKMLIGMGALGFALSSLAQCFAIKINDKIDNKKKDFMLLQETADGVVNIGLFLGVTNSVWKLSDKILKHLGFITEDALKNASNNKNINHVVSGGRIVTTMAASVAACNIITPLIRNRFAGKIRQYIEKKQELNSKNNLNIISQSQVSEPFKDFKGWENKSIKQMYKNPVNPYYNSNGKMKV